MKPWRLKRAELARAETRAAWGAVVTATFAAARAMVRTVWGCALVAIGFAAIHASDRDPLHWSGLAFAVFAIIDAILVHGFYSLISSLVIVFRPDLNIPIFCRPTRGPAWAFPLSTWAGVVAGLAIVLASNGWILRGELP